MDVNHLRLDSRFRGNDAVMEQGVCKSYGEIYKWSEKPHSYGMGDDAAQNPIHKFPRNFYTPRNRSSMFIIVANLPDDGIIQRICGRKLCEKHVCIWIRQNDAK